MSDAHDAPDGDAGWRAYVQAAEAAHLLQDRLNESAARIEALEAALQPFVDLLSAKIAEVDEYDEGFSIRPSDDYPADAIYSWALVLKWGDIRRARAALNQSQPTPQKASHAGVASVSSPAEDP